MGVNVVRPRRGLLGFGFVVCGDRDGPEGGGPGGWAGPG